MFSDGRLTAVAIAVGVKNNFQLGRGTPSTERTLPAITIIAQQACLIGHELRSSLT